MSKSVGGRNGAGLVESGHEATTRLIGDCLAGCTNGASRRFAVDEGAGLGCLNNGRIGVLDREEKDNDDEVAMVAAVIAVSPLLLLAIFPLFFSFRIVPGGFKS
mmetsp:Transcript_24802/g.27714  ORF Transcript_24802/g.27714 Transcript_24802/m.27714 type:complete len:104 (-) Transcript_24802:176-487(-)